MSVFWFALCIFLLAGSGSANDDKAEAIQKAIKKIVEDCGGSGAEDITKLTEDDACLVKCIAEKLKLTDENGNCINYENMPNADKIKECCDGNENVSDSCLKAYQNRECFQHAAA